MGDNECVERNKPKAIYESVKSVVRERTQNISRKRDGARDTNNIGNTPPQVPTHPWLFFCDANTTTASGSIILGTVDTSCCYSWDKYYCTPEHRIREIESYSLDLERANYETKKLDLETFQEV